jgi:arylsulfatase A-like enzyme
MKRARRVALVAVLTAACVAAALATGLGSHGGPVASAAGACQLGNKDGQIKHVIYLQFDNTHFRRDRADVPSDLEQMPHLLNFLKGNGTLDTNDHTILISHTAGGILSSLTGLYPDRQGQTVSNSYDYFAPDGTPKFTSSFKYWTDTVDGTNETLPNMVGDGGQTTPAPWLTYTAAGCNVGGVSAANIELENNSILPGGDIATVYGSSSPEAQEPAQQRTTDFVGIAIHCAQGAALCDTQNAKPDDSTTVPGSDNGYKALLGAKYVNPAIGGTGGCVKATDGSNITDALGNCGFPGFDGALAKNTLGEVAQMQEHGVQVSFAYISDAHDFHVPKASNDSFASSARGPGEADYQAQLKSYDDAFAAFFQNLAAHGIDKSNTLFVVTVDEGDHFAGGTGTPDPNNPGALVYDHNNCLTPTSCPSNQIGEVNVNINAALPAGEPSYDIHFDDAPTFYVQGQPERTNAAVRKLEQDAGAASLPDPYAGGAATPIAQRLADTVEESTLHMVNSDPKRTPTFTMFGNPDFFFQIGNVCKGAFPDPGVPECVNSGFAWNHGDIQDEIGNTWFGMVGPGVASNGVDSKTWSDHVDLRPTINALLGLDDNYVDDGRVVTQVLDHKAVPKELDTGNATESLGASYKQINAPFGQFAMDTLVASTSALKSSDALHYDSIESSIANLTLQRDVLAGQIRQALNEAASGTARLDEKQAKAWINEAQALLDRAHALAAANPD